MNLKALVDSYYTLKSRLIVYARRFLRRCKCNLCAVYFLKVFWFCFVFVFFFKQPIRFTIYIGIHKFFMSVIENHRKLGFLQKHGLYLNTVSKKKKKKVIGKPEIPKVILSGPHIRVPLLTTKYPRDPTKGFTTAHLFITCKKPNHYYSNLLKKLSISRINR